MCYLSEILISAPNSVWESVQKHPADMGLRTWWHLKWYVEGSELAGGFERSKMRNSNFEEIPYERVLFHPSRDGRYAPRNRKVAYFGSDLPTATCETMFLFRNNPACSEIVAAYFKNELEFDNEGYGYPLEFELGASVKVADLRHPNNRLFEFIAEEGPWHCGQKFADKIAMSPEEEQKKQTQLIANRAFELGFNGVWYNSVRTPSGTFVMSGECLVLFEGSEDLITHWGSSS